ncbi:hypothetical protein EWE75_00585 [Sphingomonas populi]|uniref:Peptidase inhibitor I78 family protein n=1 Tax=Sphingomonas populi TaxID=2484750 RepID=A0A4Q6YA31_9SPHN|nr:I78 family peptidase inhibitor [Sphingomonas populi]RZF66396.1 hypothetical protein EWE75_00585 [Sphingomonas populi]
MKSTAFTLVTASALLVACAPTTHETPTAPAAHDTTPAPHQCQPEAASKLVGHAAPDDAQVKQRTGASTIRRIAPGDMVTHDFRVERITLAIDPAGKVVQAPCG